MMSIKEKSTDGSSFRDLIRQLEEQETPDGRKLSQTESSSEGKKSYNGNAPPMSEVERLQAELEYFREENRRIYGEYQDHIRAEKGLVSEIVKGAKAGEPAEALLLMALQIIDHMRGDVNLATYHTVEKTIENNRK